MATDPNSSTGYFTEAGLKTITEAIQTGTLSVYYGDKRVEYRSLDDMVRIRNMMLVALGYANPQGGRTYTVFRKGIHRGDSEGPEGGYDRNPYSEDSQWGYWH